MRRRAARPNSRDALETGEREAEGAFGDPSVYLEQVIVRPRHIEVQVLADAGGKVVHLSSATAPSSGATRR